MILDDLFVNIVRSQFLALHQQLVLWSSCQWYDEPQNQIGDKTYTLHEEQCQQEQAPQDGVAKTNVVGYTRAHTSQQLIVGVAEQTAVFEVMTYALPQRCSAGVEVVLFGVCVTAFYALPTVFRFSFSAFRFLLSGNLLGIAYLAYDFLYYFYADGIYALFLLLPQEFCHTVFYVVGYFFATVLAAEVALHALQIVVQQLVCILVYII